MKTKCLIVDNEPLAREIIHRYVEKLENFEIEAVCSSAMEAINVLQKKHVDLIFMDIHMPQMTGIDFLKTLKHSPKVIIITAHKEYAIDCFDLNVVDYLLKPIDFERFLKSVNKYYQTNMNLSDPLPRIIGSSKKLPAESFIYVKDGKKVLKVYLSEIRYIEAFCEYIQIYTDKGKVITKSSLIHMEKKLSNFDFLRIHKSFIVPISKVNAFTLNTIEIEGKELPIGRTFKHSTFDALNFSEAQLCT